MGGAAVLTSNTTEGPANASEVTQTVTLKRSVSTDDVTGVNTYGAWTTGSWDEVDSPAVAGYDTLDKAKVDSREGND